MIDYRQQSLIEFKRLTKIDLELFFFKVELFFTSKKNDIADYYKGNINTPNNSAFALLNECLEDSYVICAVFRNQRKQFDKLVFWELVEQIQDIRDSLETASKLYKYLKSSLGKYNFSSQTVTKFTLTKGNTLENVSRELLNQSDWDNDYQQIAFKNDLSEEDYGDTSIEIDLDLINKSITKPNVVVDSMQGDNYLGKDFLRKITFVSTGQIIKTGRITINENSVDVIGTGTLFVQELAIGDIIIFNGNIIGIIVEIVNNLLLRLDRVATYTSSNMELYVSIDEDFVILLPQETAKQSAEILLTLKQKDNPESPLLGQNSSQNIGVSSSIFSLPSISRALNTVFATDDTFSSIDIVKMQKIDDSVDIVVNIRTIKNEILQIITVL